jgi:hypothetical protein
LQLLWCFLLCSATRDSPTLGRMAAEADFTAAGGSMAAGSMAGGFTTDGTGEQSPLAIGGHWNHGWRGGGYGWGTGLGLGLGLGFGLGYPYDWGYYPPDYGYYGYSQPYAATQYWYYCSNPAGYYPYVTQCNTGWQTVPAS